MSELDPFRGQPVLRVLRELYVARRTARLEVEHEDGRQELRTRDGELLLRADDPLTLRLEAANPRHRPELLLAAMDEWITAQVRVEDGGEGAGEWRALFPTSTLLLEAASRALGGRESLAILGGEQARLIAVGGEAEMMRLPGIEPEDAFLYSRLASPAGLSGVVAQGSLSRDETRVRLCRLVAVGLVAPAPRHVEPAAPEPGDSAAVKLQQRIAEDLASRPLRLSAGEHRDRVGALAGRFAALDHYELLGVPPSASPEEIHLAFVELARMVHPLHAARLELARGSSALELLFERAAGAYLTLGDPLRRVEYNAELGVSGALAGAKTPAQLEEERRKIARRGYDLAGELALMEDYHFAIEMLRQAVRADPKPEYWALLASCQAKNRNWLGQAAESARQAVARKPEDPGYRCLLARILEETGDPAGAVAEYSAALERMSEHPDALAGLERLAAARRAEKSAGGGVLGKLRDRLQRRS